MSRYIVDWDYCSCVEMEIGACNLGIIISLLFVDCQTDAKQKRCLENRNRAT